MLDYAFQHRLDTDALLGRDRDGGERVESEILIDLLADTLDIRRRQIDLVDHWQQIEIVLEREVQVGDGLRLHPLGRVDDNNRPVAGHQRATHLVGEVDVARGIDEVELVALTTRRHVVERHRVALDGDAALALDVHVIEQLVAELPRRNRSTGLDEAVGKRRLAMVDVGDDAEVADVPHGARAGNTGWRKATTGMSAKTVMRVAGSARG